MKDPQIKNYERELIGIKDFLFYLLTVWTVVILVLVWLDFLFKKFNLPNSIVFSYLILLGAYIASKEANRWGGVKMRIRPGQFFVYLWWINLLLMFVLSFFYKNLEVGYQVKDIAYNVTGGLIISELSKIFQIRSQKRQINNQE